MEISSQLKSPHLLSRITQTTLVLLAFVLVAMSQPAWSIWSGLIAALLGYALFWRVLIDLSGKKQKFWLATAWFTAIQLVQLSWSLSHPFIYIYGVYLFCAIVLGVQFGLLSMFMTPARIKSLSYVLLFSAAWTLLEWLRLFFFSGFSWNPVGLALTGNIYPLQTASLWGVFGLSFWVIFVNLLALRAYLLAQVNALVLWSTAALFPYLFGGIHLAVHSDLAQKHSDPKFSVLLVQTAFAAEEALPFSDPQALIAHVFQEWRHILTLLKSHQGASLDLIVLPEFVVPYGTYTYLFLYEDVYNAFKSVFGEESLVHLPPNHAETVSNALLRYVETPQGYVALVNNAFWLQGIANVFQTGIVAGLEDVEDVENHRHSYSAAIYFQPNHHAHIPGLFSADRYEKRVLVPMGEYFPFEFCKELAAKYGVQGSFTPGKQAKVFESPKLPFGLSICYEETFGDLMRQNKQLGAKLLVNLTSDVWYPNSRLPQQHFDHARLRTVESGIPLARACNTGVTGVIDSLGRIVAILGESAENPEWISAGLQVDVPTYTYATIYSHTGDKLIIGFCLAILAVCSLVLLVKKDDYR